MSSSQTIDHTPCILNIGDRTLDAGRVLCTMVWPLPAAQANVAEASEFPEVSEARPNRGGSQNLSRSRQNRVFLHAILKFVSLMADPRPSTLGESSRWEQWTATWKKSFVQSMG